jgi:hypothetical protein
MIAMDAVIISYSKGDHALALKLSAFLESEGWTVWWDVGRDEDSLWHFGNIIASSHNCCIC